MLVNKTLPTRWSPPMGASRRAHACKSCAFLALALAATIWTGVPAAFAQDVQGIELRTRETRLDRRTGCLQSNIEYLQQLIAKNALDTQQKLAAANREIAAQKDASAAAAKEIAALKDTLAGMQARLARPELSRRPLPPRRSRRFGMP